MKPRRLKSRLHKQSPPARTNLKIGFKISSGKSNKRPLGGDRSLVRTFTALVENEIKPLVDRGIPFDTKLLLQIFKSSANDIARIRDFCRDRYGLTDSRLALFGVSMGASNPMTYIERVKPNRSVRFLVGECDRIVNIRDARDCANKFPDNACYVVPGMGHGQINYGRSFVDHVRYFLATQLGDWQS